MRVLLNSNLKVKCQVRIKCQGFLKAKCVSAGIGKWNDFYLEL